MRVVGVSKPYDEALAQRDADLAPRRSTCSAPAAFGAGVLRARAVRGAARDEAWPS